MFWLLIALFFNADGSHNAQVQSVPTQEECQARSDKLKTVLADKAARPPELAAVGILCLPVKDPTAPTVPL